MKFHFYSDPGHGWLKVPITLLKKLNILHKMTMYSYQHGNYAYLEEDHDGVIFYETFESTIEPIELVHHNSNTPSKIRSYGSLHVKNN